jgi:hypothetical protein
MGVLRIKNGVEFTTIAPGGFRILAALDQAAKLSTVDLWITSACDGEHSGPADPHPKGEAYDVRTHDLEPARKNGLVKFVMSILGFERFYGFLEDAGTPNEHAHFQVKKGTEYP